jgi:AmmeMemoRadiSam system protein A
MKEFSLTQQQQQELLAIARQSITRYLNSRTLPSLTVADPELQQPAAVFVTLTQHGALRGCIGTTEPREALAAAVSSMAVAAATEDYRFLPLTAAELATIRIEISVLSPLRQVNSADEIHQPVHGVVVKRNGRSGLFLPQVWEHFSTKEDFLSELCSQKAGLPANAWKDPATSLYVFTVVSFEEK